MIVEKRLVMRERVRNCFVMFVRDEELSLLALF